MLPTDSAVGGIALNVHTRVAVDAAGTCRRSARARHAHASAFARRLNHGVALASQPARTRHFKMAEAWIARTASVGSRAAATDHARAATNYGDASRNRSDPRPRAAVADDSRRRSASGTGAVPASHGCRPGHALAIVVVVQARTRPAADRERRSGERDSKRPSNGSTARRGRHNYSRIGHRRGFGPLIIQPLDREVLSQ
jgi:hypothetical protein